MVLVTLLMIGIGYKSKSSESRISFRGDSLGGEGGYGSLYIARHVGT